MWDDELRTPKTVDPRYMLPIAKSSFEPDMIMPGLWIGPAESRSPKVLEEYPMDAICSLGDTLEDYDHYGYLDNVVYKHYAIEDWDTSPIQSILDEACDFIRTHLVFGRSVLVHCQMGISRSATICIAYLIKYERLSYKDAHAKVQSARDIIYPNDGFIKQLLEWETKSF